MKNKKSKFKAKGDEQGRAYSFDEFKGAVRIIFGPYAEVFTGENPAEELRWYRESDNVLVIPNKENVWKWSYACSVQGMLGARVLMLVGPEPGEEWFDSLVTPFADVYKIEGMQLPGTDTEDFVLCHYWKAGGRVTKWLNWQKETKS